MKKVVLGIVLVVALFSVVTRIMVKSSNIYEAEVTMHRGYVEDVGLPDGPGR